MIPLRLKVQAFGPYVQPQEVDFGRARSAGVFLIHGPTGSGKTTLFDAICFALYGESSGAERTGKQLRSHLAPPELRTEVELEFLLGDWRYRAWRSPGRDAPARRGKGHVPAKPEANLYRRPAEGPGDWTLLATGVDRVTEAAQQVLGFSNKEFRQVILIPQGRFRDLLVAGTEDRGTILSNLFDTALYQRIETGLKDQARQWAQEYETLRERHGTMLQTGHVSSMSELTERIGLRLAQLEALQAEVGQGRERHEAARKACEEGRRVRRLFEEARAARGHLLDLQRREPEIGRLREALEAARRALALADLAEALERQRQEARRREEARDRSGRDLEAARQALELAREALEQQRRKAPETGEMERRLQEFSEMGPRFDALEEAEHQAREAEEHRARAEERLREARERLAALEKEQHQLDGETQVLGPLAEDVARREAFRNEETRRRDLRAAIAEQERQRQAGEAVRQRRAALERQTAEALREARRRLEEAMALGLREMAALLSAGLVPGQPCPVCGSTHHPAPAPVREDLPDSSALEGLRRAVGEAEAAWQAAAEQARQQQEQQARLSALIDEKARELGEDAAASLEDLEARCREAERRLKEARDAARRLEKVRVRQREVEGLLREERQALEALQEQAQEARSAWDRAMAQREERRSGLPEGLTRESWRRQVETLQREVASRKKALENAEASFQEAAQRGTRAETRFQEADTEWQRSRAERDQEEERFRERLRQQGFESSQAWEAARLSPEQMEADRKHIETWEQEVERARYDVTRLENATAGLQEPDVEALEASEAEARDHLEARQRTLAQAEAEQQRDRELQEQLRLLEEQMATQETRLREMQALASVAGGTNPRKLAFHDFVLGLLLDEVLEAANLRLREMSRNRFQLYRRLDPTDFRRKEGLELDVEDAYSGRRRAVQTLSGGESFLAALALSLGLADVVQQRAGGIRLETLFLDEGFGNLDAEAREEAWNHLAELSGQGGRLVGIISHMEDLKALCPHRLHVQGGPDGSTVRWMPSP